MHPAALERRLGSPQPTTDNKKQKSSSIKFNRKQQSGRGDKKKIESPRETTQRICFISPLKSNIPSNELPIAITALANANFSKIRQSFVLPKEQSCILANESPFNHEQKLNDSMLSLMEELKGDNQRKYDSDMQQYLALISSLREEIDHLQSENASLKSKVKDIEMLQQFLMQRETYISEVTDRNINLNEQLHCIQTANERLRGELRQLQDDYNNQHQMYQSYISTLKQEKEAMKNEFDMIMKLNIELNEKLQERAIKKGERFKRVFREKSEETGEISPKRLMKEGHENIRNHRSLVKNDFSQLIETCETAKSKETDLSQLNVKSMDEYSILQKLNDQCQPCDCIDLTKKLKQKIRYSQIQIDILKRIKVNGEKIKEDNEKLKSQNRKLRSKLNHFSSKVQKKERRGANSDSSLELSLSPSKG